MDKEEVKELIQDELNEKNLAKELKNILDNPIKQVQLKGDYAALKNLLRKGRNESSQGQKILRIGERSASLGGILQGREGILHDQRTMREFRKNGRRNERIIQEGRWNLQDGTRENCG